MEKVEILNSFLQTNKLQAECISTYKRGCLDIFELKTQNSFRLNKLSNLSRELMLTMRGYSTPSIKIDYEKSLIQIEMMSERNQTFSLIDDLQNIKYDTNDKLPITIGTSFHGDKISIDISKNPHLLVGGTTGSGKSSLLHNIIANSLQNTHADIHVVDTKSFEYSQYTKVNKRCKIVDNFKDYKSLLEYLIFLMEKRYRFIKQYSTIENIDASHFKPVILIIDEFADLSMQDDGSGYRLLCRLVQKCRAAGIYCVLATQRPSVDIITGVIKANFPARIACKVTSKIDSRVILDSSGAEGLNCIGNAIISNYKYNLERFQISFSPIKDIIKYLNEKMETNV